MFDQIPGATSREPVVVITGASAGVGRATARAFARRGARVGLMARGRDGLEAARQEIEELGGKALVLPTDVADADQVEAAASAVEAEFGPIDIWVNNAMVTVFSPVQKMTPEDFRRVTEVSYLGYVYGTLAALRRMVPRNRGTIVQVGSALAYRSIPLQSAYCGAKHAIQGFTDSVRCELMHDQSQVKITMVQMPALNTPQFTWSKTQMPRNAQPVPPIYQPELAADAIVHAVDHYRREWYVAGPTRLAVTGDMLAPGVGDWYLAQQGYGAQQYDGQVDPDRPNNLYEPLPGDYGAHGDFDDRASATSWEYWLERHRNWLLAGMGVVGLVRLLVWGRDKIATLDSGDEDSGVEDSGDDSAWGNLAANFAAYFRPERVAEERACRNGSAVMRRSRARPESVSAPW